MIKYISLILTLKQVTSQMNVIVTKVMWSTRVWTRPYLQLVCLLTETTIHDGTCARRVSLLYNLSCIGSSYFTVIRLHISNFWQARVSDCNWILWCGLSMYHRIQSSRPSGGRSSSTWAHQSYISYPQVAVKVFKVDTGKDMDKNQKVNLLTRVCHASLIALW